MVGRQGRCRRGDFDGRGVVEHRNAENDTNDGDYN